MNRFWVSWVSGYYANEGCTKPPFKVWVTGTTERHQHGLSDSKYLQFTQIKNEKLQQKFLTTNQKDDCVICAIVIAESEIDVWAIIGKHFPDYSERFCEECADDWAPGDRFQ